jgi:hypothetical protein
MSWYLSKPIFLWLNKYTLPNKLFQSISFAYASANDGVLAFYRGAIDAKKRQTLSTVRRIKSETVVELFDVEACQLSAMVDATAKIGGDMAEVGTYNGGSAKIICEVKGDRPLHLFDTFEGIPEVEEIDTHGYDVEKFAVGQYAASLEAVMSYLKKYPNVFFYKGLFPRLPNLSERKRFHLFISTWIRIRAR